VLIHVEGQPCCEMMSHMIPLTHPGMQYGTYLQSAEAPLPQHDIGPFLGQQPHLSTRLQRDGVGGRANYCVGVAGWGGRRDQFKTPCPSKILVTLLEQQPYCSSKPQGQGVGGGANDCVDRGTGWRGWKGFNPGTPNLPADLSLSQHSQRRRA
jgi:hypothetical protein